MSIATLNDRSADRASARPRRRSAAKAEGRRPGGRVKASLLLSDELDFRLSTIARSQKLDKSALASQLLDAGLRRYALDAVLRQHAGAPVEVNDRPDPAGE